MVPTLDSFDPANDFTLCEIDPLTWHTIKDSCVRHKPRALGALFPLFTQIESVFHAASAHTGIPSIILPQEKYELLARIAPEADLGGVILMNSFHDRFTSTARSLIPHHPLYYQVIWPIDTDVRSATWHQHTYHEIHVLPGLMCLFQCSELAHARAALFHVSDALTFTHANRHLTLSGALEKEKESALPYSFENEGVCACGRTTFRII